eukprot:11645653-Ditylum_brightwellii.AAC.1
MYHHNNGQRELPFIHVTLLQTLLSAILLKPVCQQVMWLETIASGRLLHKCVDTSFKEKDDPDLQLVNRFTRGGI